MLHLWSISEFLCEDTSNPLLPMEFSTDLSISLLFNDGSTIVYYSITMSSVSQIVNYKHESRANRETVLINIMLSAQQSGHCSVVRQPNPALSSLDERWKLLCFSILLDFWAWWVRPSYVWNFPFQWQWLICGMQDRSDANTRTNPDTLMKSVLIKSQWMWNFFRKILQLFTKRYQAFCSSLVCHWEAQMPLFVQGLCMCVRACLHLLRSVADASVWGVLEMCPWPPISTTVFAHCNDAPISIKTVPVLTCQDLLWATAPPLLCHLMPQDPRSWLVNGCHQAFNHSVATDNGLAATLTIKVAQVILFILYTAMVGKRYVSFHSLGSFSIHPIVFHIPIIRFGRNFTNDPFCPQC